MAVSVTVSTQYTNVTDIRQTPQDGIGRVYAQHRAAKNVLSTFIRNSLISIVPCVEGELARLLNPYILGP